LRAANVGQHVVSNARHIYVRGDRVNGRGSAVLVTGAAHVGRLQQRIDDERQRDVVMAERETIGVVRGVERVGHADRLRFAARIVLKRDGGGEGHRTVAGVGDQLALRADFKRVGTGEFDVDSRRIMLRSKSEIFSTLLPVARSCRLTPG